MVRLSDLISEEVPIEVTVAGHTIHAVYRLGQRLPGMTVEQLELPLVDLIPRLIVSWDLTDDAGVPVPVTVEACESIPVSVLRVLWRWILMDDALGEAVSSSPAG